MARRAVKPLTPLLVALVAIVLGFLAIGTSFADTGSVAPSDGPIPASTTSVSTGPQVPVAPSAVVPSETVPTGAPAPKPKVTKTIDPGPMSCASCMAPPGS